MKLKTSIQVESGVERTYFELLRFEMVKEGLQISAKSPLFAAWVAGFCKKGETRQLTSGLWRNIPFAVFKVTAPEFPPPGFSAYCCPDDGRYFDGSGNANVAWVLHPDLGKGFTCVTRAPLALNDWEDYAQKSFAFVRDVYIRLLRKATVEATFSEIWPKVA